MGWSVESFTGSAAVFHGRDLPERPGRAVWVFDVDRPALALGSAQPLDDADARACESAGVEIVRRRSGGGAVLLVPGGIVWIDVLIPPGDPLWHDDISRSGWWVGETWLRAVERLLGPADLAVHRGRVVESAWSRRVCFSGLGPGEVTAGPAKLVGISQRRTRAGARFQTAVHRRWEPLATVGLLASPGPTVGELGPVAVLQRSSVEIVEAFAAALP